MEDHQIKLKNLDEGNEVHGFELIKKEAVPSKCATLYTLKHTKSGAQLLYFDRVDENKTFAITFKTLPEDNTGVFHILEHSVLGGSEHFPVKEPFVSLLQSSLQTFLNAITFSDKTVYPVSSRNEQDFKNLMTVYLDGVFHPLIEKQPAIFMQEGWHYEFEDSNKEPYYNGVVYSEMKGAFSSVDTLIREESQRLLFPDNSYGYVSGGHPENITDLTYEQFLQTHKRFYHPSNAKIILDGSMNIEAILELIDSQYLSNYECRTNDFDFRLQTMNAQEKSVYYAATEEESKVAQMAVSKILCRYDEIEKIYAAKILADYLTGSNEAPLKRAFLEKGLAQDVSLSIMDGVLQPFSIFIVRNASVDDLNEIQKFLPDAVQEIVKQGLDKEALLASVERMKFNYHEMIEPYGINLTLKVLDSWLYDGDPLAHIENDAVFQSLHTKIEEGYFEDLLVEMLAGQEHSYLYVLPSLSKAEEDAKREMDKVSRIVQTWDEEKRAAEQKAFMEMMEWQQTMDSEEALRSLPHLNLADIPEEVKAMETVVKKVADRDVIQVVGNTNGIGYLNAFFDVSDFSLDELRLLSVVTGAFGELGTKNDPAKELQKKIKAKLGQLIAKIEVISKPNDPTTCTPYLVVSASMLEENVEDAMAIISEILVNGTYDEPEKLYEILLQLDYFVKQGLIEEGHMFAIQKSLCAFSKENALKEELDGESFIRWFTPFVETFMEHSFERLEQISKVCKKAFSQNRLFIGYSGNLTEETLEHFIQKLPKREKENTFEIERFDRNHCAIDISASVGYSAFGHNLYALGGEYTGACSVLASLMTFGYLWGAIRVQGGAYGTGMNVSSNGDIFCYSYRDPNLSNTFAAYTAIPDVLEEFLAQGMPLDDIIIGTVNTTDPLLGPAEVCMLACTRYLKGIHCDTLTKIRKEILHTTHQSLQELVPLLRKYVAEAKFCAVADKEATAFLG